MIVRDCMEIIGKTAGDFLGCRERRSGDYSQFFLRTGFQGPDGLCFLCVGAMMCIYKMCYEWEERKNLENQRKHGGISFELAALVFEDERRLIELDRVDEAGEQRWHALGAVSIVPGVGVVLLVVHAYRIPDGDGMGGAAKEVNDEEEIVRIISARRADKHELERYQEQAVD